MEFVLHKFALSANKMRHDAEKRWRKKHRANKRRSVFYISFHNDKLFFSSTCKEFLFNIIDRCSLSSDDNLKPIWLTTDVRKCSFQRLFHYNTFRCYPSHIKRVLKKFILYNDSLHVVFLYWNPTGEFNSRRLVNLVDLLFAWKSIVCRIDV